MNKLLAEVIDAHGGMDRWNACERVEASIVSGGGFFPLKGLIQDADPRQMTVWLHEQRSSVLPYGARGRAHDVHTGPDRHREGRRTRRRCHPGTSSARTTRCTTPSARR